MLGPDTTLNADWSQPASAANADERILLSEADLAAWLGAQFHTYPGCSSVTVAQVVRLDKPDSQGCNWSRSLFLDSGGASPSDYAPAYAAIVEMARSAFNLKPEEAPEAPL